MKKTRYLCTKVGKQTPKTIAVTSGGVEEDLVLGTLSHRRVTLVDLYRYPAINPKTFRREVELAFG